MRQEIYQVMFHWGTNSFQAEADLYWCFYKKVFWKYAANLQENTHAELRYHTWRKFSTYIQNFSREYLGIGLF